MLYNYNIQFSDPNIKEFTYFEKSRIKSLLVYEMPEEYRKQVNKYN